MEKRILVATLIFPREKSRFVLLSSSSVLLCGPRPRPRGVTLVPDPDCVFCGNHSLTHSRTRTVTLTRAALTRTKRKEEKKDIVLMAY